MIRDTESLHAAQQILCTNAINQLNASIHNFQFLQHIDGREPKGRQILAEQLIEIEDWEAPFRLEYDTDISDLNRLALLLEENSHYPLFPYLEELVEKTWLTP